MRNYSLSVTEDATILDVWSANHCVVRTPNGNDYGKDLLKQHYLAHSHTT